MLANIRKHQGWLWIIIAVVVISFVLWGAQTQKLASSVASSDNFGIVLGKPVSADQFRNAYNEARLRYFFNNGEWPDQAGKRKDFDEQRETYFRLLEIQEMEDMGIHVSSEAVGEAATARILQLTQGHQMPLKDFVDRVLAPAHLTDEDLARFFSHEIGLDEMVSIVGAGGKMVTPAEVRSLYQREHEEVSVQAIFFQASNYLSRVSVTTPAFMQFYTNHMSQYHLPDRVQVNYVRFAASNFLAEATHDMEQITNLDDVINANLERMGTNFDAEAKTPEQKKAKLRQMMLDRQALLEATKKANQFTENLGNLDPKQGDLALLAKSNGLAVHLSAPFDRDTPPDDLEVGPDFAQRAFELSSDQWYFGPIKGDGAAYVIELARQLPDENPPFEEVRNRVLADYKFTESLMLARLAGGEFYASMTNAVNRGKSFAALAAEAGVHPEYLPPLSISTRSLPEVEDRVQLSQFKEAVFGTPVGQASQFVPDADGGYIVFVQSKLPISESQMEADLPKFTAMVQQNRQYEAFNRWFNVEAQRGLRDTPIMRQQQPGASGGSPPQN